MALRKILCIDNKLDNEILHKPSKKVDAFDSKLFALLDDMKETLKKANGAGLSAVQVGILKRAFIVDIEGDTTEFVNPIILSKSGKNSILEEGCLSVPHAYAKISRPNKVVVKAQDRNGNIFTKTFVGFGAKAICHEYDHLNGVLYIDNLEPNQIIKDNR